MDMGSVCRDRSAELGSASIQTDGHGFQLLGPGAVVPRSSRKPPPKGGTAGNVVYLFEPDQTRCTAVNPSRQNSCPSMSIVSEPLLGEPN